MKIVAAGSSNYLKEGVKYLSENGFEPEFIIENDRKVIEFEKEIKKQKIDLLVCLAYPNILKKNEIDLFNKGCINLHAGLPAYRGRHPVPTMLIDGLDEIPVSVHFMDEGIDTGKIITHDTILVDRDDTYENVMKKILNIEKPLLLYAIKQIATNTFYARDQHKDKMKYRPKRKPEDSQINWQKKSLDVYNFINAVSGVADSFTYDDNNNYVTITKALKGDRPGKVLSRTEDGYYIISTKDGVVMVNSTKKLNVGDQLKIESKK